MTFAPTGSTRERSYGDSFIKTLGSQQLLWTYLKNDTELEFEIIQPLKATVRDYKGGGYVKFFILVCKTSDENLLHEGDYISFQLPIKTWERAMYSVPMAKKKLWLNLGDDNIYFKGRKVNKTLLILDYIERRKCTEEQRELSKPVYEKW